VFDRYSRVQEETTELNVIPVMNLFMVLIPFLLLGAAFFHISVIPTSTPTHDPHESDVPKTPKTVAVNLVLAHDKADLTASSVSLTPDELHDLAAKWDAPGGKYPLDEIQKQLVSIKEQYPKSNTITILAHDDLGYQELVDVLDHTRERRVGTLANDEPKYEELFPVTIFSKLLVKEEKEGMTFGDDSGDDQ